MHTAFYQRIRRLENLGVPFVYEGVHYYTMRKQNADSTYTVGIGCEATGELRLQTDCLHIPNGVDYVGSFIGSRIKTVVFPASVRKIGGYAFNGVRLENIKLAPNSQLEEISFGAFASCGHLTKVDLRMAHKLRVIDSHAFKDCVALEELWLPPELETIAHNAFRGCSDLHTVHLSRTTNCPEHFLRSVITRQHDKGIQKVFY